MKWGHRLSASVPHPETQGGLSPRLWGNCGAPLCLNQSQGEMRRRWETSDEDESFSRYG